MDKKYKYGFDIAITLLFGGLISFLGYLFNIYLARNLSSEDFSIYNAAIGIVYLVQIPAITIQAYITQKVAQNIYFDLTSFKWKSLKIFATIGVVLAVIISLFAPIISSSVNIPINSVFTLAFVLFASLISPIPKGILFGLQKILEVNVIMLVETVLKFGMGMVVLWMIPNINIAILANGLPLLLSGLILLPLIKFKKNESREPGINLRELSFVFLSFFLINTPFTFDLLLVNTDIRAEYGALSLIGKIVFFACIMIANTMFAQISKAERIYEKKIFLIRSLLLSLGIGTVLSILFYTLNSSLIEIIFKGLYTSISQYTWVVGIGMTLYALAYLITNYLIIINSRNLNYFLLIPLVLQIILFSFFNESIGDVIWNQIIVMSVLLVTVTVLFKKS